MAIPALRQNGYDSTDRREFLLKAGGGFGSIALAAMLADERKAVGGEPKSSPFAPKPPHFQPKAKSVIFLFMDGGPSHLDLFDPKPALQKLAGKPLPASFGRVDTAIRS